MQSFSTASVLVFINTFLYILIFSYFWWRNNLQPSTVSMCMARIVREAEGNSVIFGIPVYSKSCSIAWDSWGNKGRARVGYWAAPDLLYACSGFVEMFEDASQCRDFPLGVTRWCLHCPLLFQPPFCPCIVLLYSGDEERCAVICGLSFHL